MLRFLKENGTFYTWKVGYRAALKRSDKFEWETLYGLRWDKKSDEETNLAAPGEFT